MVDGAVNKIKLRRHKMENIFYTQTKAKVTILAYAGYIDPSDNLDIDSYVSFRVVLIGCTPQLLLQYFISFSLVLLSVVFSLCLAQI